MTIMEKSKDIKSEYAGSMFNARWDLLEQAKAKWAREHPRTHDEAFDVFEQMVELARDAGALPRHRSRLDLEHKLRYARAINSHATPRAARHDAE